MVLMPAVCATMRILYIHRHDNNADNGIERLCPACHFAAITVLFVADDQPSVVAMIFAIDQWY